MSLSSSPIITRMQVIPVAGYDSMLMTLSGAHAPCFTRNLVILQDSAGHTGIGEIHGGDYTCDCLNAIRPLVEGAPVACYRQVLQRIHKLTGAKENGAKGSDGIQTLDISKLKFVVRSEWAVECAMLDLMGQFVGQPLCQLLGEGRQRDKVEVLGYLFYVSDKAKYAGPGPAYIDESGSADPWFRLRRQEILTPARIVEEAQAVHEKYGVSNFKLKGGVLPGEEEMEALRALKKAFPAARINIDPNGAWSLDEAIRLCRPMRDVITYVEDPCGPEAGYSGREIMREFKNAVQLPVATNMIATDWRQFYHTASLNACDIILADPHFWGFDGAVRMSQLLDAWGLTWGIHSNNHFDVTLAAFAHVGAAAVGDPAPIDTHWIWQDGQNLLDDTPQIAGGFLQVPEGPGLGVHLNMEKVTAANALYRRLPSHDRNDAAAMQAARAGVHFRDLSDRRRFAGAIAHGVGAVGNGYKPLSLQPVSVSVDAVTAEFLKLFALFENVCGKNEPAFFEISGEKVDVVFKKSEVYRIAVKIDVKHFPAARSVIDVQMMPFAPVAVREIADKFYVRVTVVPFRHRLDIPFEIPAVYRIGPYRYTVYSRFSFAEIGTGDVVVRGACVVYPLRNERVYLILGAFSAGAYD